MSPKELLAYLVEHEIELRAEGDRLRVNAPRGALTAELRSLIGAHKAELLALLLDPEPQTRELSLSEGQRALWFLCQLVPDGSAYNVSLALRLNGPLVAAGLQAALRRLGELHPVLCAQFAAPDGAPLMRIDGSRHLAAEVIDAQHWSAEQLQAQVQALSERPFQLGTEGASRLALFVHSPREAVLLLSFHHIVIDYWSLTIVTRDLAALYHSACTRRLDETVEPQRSYLDFIKWQRRFLASSEGARQRQFWHRQLAGELPVLDLPTDHHRPAVRSERGGGVRAELAHALTAQLRRLAAEEGTTAFVVLLSGLVALLHCYTGQEEVAVGTPYHGRSRKDFEQGVGYFVNSLVLRARVPRNTTFRELLRHLHAVTVETLSHPDYPFSLLVEELSPQRDASRNPLFQVMIDWLAATDPLLRTLADPDTPAPLAFGDLQASPLDLRQIDGVADQIWLIGDLGSKIALKLGYSADLFEESTARSTLAHFIHLLTSATQDPDRSVSTLALLNDAEQYRIVARSGQPRASPFAPVTRLFAVQAARTPEALALGGPGPLLTYRELEENSNQLGQLLRARGVAAESVVGLCVEQPIDLLTGVLGILKAGGACALLDALAGPSHVDTLLSDHGHAVLITTERLRSQLSRLPAAVVCLDSSRDELKQLSRQEPAGEPTAHDLAAVFHSDAGDSGARGAMLEQGAVTEAVRLSARSWGITEGCRVLLQVTGNPSVAVLNILATLCSGATLFLRPPVPAVDDLRPVLLDAQITTLITTAAAAAALLLDGLPALERVIIQGPPTPPVRLKNISRHIKVIAAYGHPETIGCSAVAELDSRDETACLIGRSMDHAKLLILDEQRRPVPVGVSGELHVGGPGLARGYWRAGLLASERFIADPFAGHPGARLFRTGDRVRYRADGTIEYLGRISDKTRVSQARINRTRIEGCCLANPAVQDCVVVNRAAPTEPCRLVAYVQLAPHRRLNARELLQHLGTLLPPAEIPAGIIFVDKLPLTQHGCVALPLLPPESRNNGASAYMGPRDPLEQKLVHIWERVLRRQPLGIRDDFFALGGHSMLAVQVRMQVQLQLQQDIPLSEFNRSSTVEQLAEYLRCRPPAPEQSPLVILRSGTRHPLYLVHPIGGSTLCYVELVRRFPKDEMIFGLQSPALGSSGPQPETMEQLAAQYVTAIRSSQPEGPYRLIGWSFGGILALEMAQQLTEQGGQVDLLALIDSVPPAMLESFPELDDSGVLSLLQGRGPGHAEGSFTDRGHADQLLRLYRHQVQLMRKYSPRPSAGRMLVFLASERGPMPALEATANAWRALSTASLELHTVPGDHFSLLSSPASLAFIVQTLQTALGTGVRY